jgi:hypothetical protein
MDARAINGLDAEPLDTSGVTKITAVETHNCYTPKRAVCGCFWRRENRSFIRSETGRRRE